MLAAGICGYSGGQTCFDVSTAACGNNPTPVASGDLNGDGRPDVIVGNLDSDTISLLFHNGAGFDAPVPHSAGDQPWGVAIGDLNGDDRPDVVVANFGPASSNVHVRFNQGAGVLGPPTTLVAGARPITPVIVDLDGDTDNDIVVTNFVGDSFSVFKNNGNGTFAAAVTYGAGNDPQGMACADLNGDSFPDVVTVDIGSDTVSVFMNNGSGVFGVRTPYATGPNPYYCVLVNLDTDGDRDIAITNYNNSNAGSVTVMKNNGDGTFSGRVDYAAGNGPIGIDAADFDGDCDADLLVSHYLSNSVMTMINAGGGTFPSRPQTGVAGFGYGLVAGDFDGDGAPDGVVAMRQSNTVTLLGNECWVIGAQPSDASVCPLGTAQFSVSANGPESFAWYKNGLPLSDGPTETGSVVSGANDATVSIEHCTEEDEGVYACVVTTGCHERTSQGVTLTVCPPDFDCDGFVSGVDFDLYVQAFEAGEMSADFDGDGFVTGIDFDLYVQSFEAGC